jgi:F420-0:gamma-glutamyl ligase
MGQGSEKQPVIIIKGFDKKNYSTNDAFDLVVDEDEDLYR